MKDFYNLFVDELKHIYSAEKQILEALPEMAKEASNPKLKEVLHQHVKETKKQVERLEAIGAELNEDFKRFECDSMKSLLKDAKKEIKANFNRPSHDAAIINWAQKVEHFEIASYGILKAFAKHLKLDYIYKLLEESSKEEGHANKQLTEIAEGTLFNAGINTEASKKCA